MGRLAKILLTEKISKKEMDDALANPNIIVGAEFEFYMREDYLNDNSQYEEEQEQYEDYQREWRQWRSKMEEYQDEYNEWQSKQDDWYEKRDEWLAEKRAWKAYDEAMKNYTGSLFGDDDEPEKPDFPRPDDELPDEPDEPDAPTPPDYPDYVRNERAFIDDNDDRSIYPPNEDNSNSRDDAGEEAFNDYKNAHRLNFITRDWQIKQDGSLDSGPGGVEVVTPPMPLDKFLEVCPKMFDAIKKCGEVDDTCGLHIGMSLKNVEILQKELDIVKLILLTDEEYIWKFFDMRKYNKYTASSRKTLVSNNIPIVKNFVDIKKMKDNYGTEKWQGINVNNLDNYRNGYIEFRYMGGEDYHTKWEEIKKVIAHYAHNISAACDPQYKRKEYLLKLNRIMFRADYVEKRNRMRDLEDSIRNDNDIEGDEKELKELKIYIADLEKRFKFDNEDVRRLAGLIKISD
jgi:hypothetical protein